jgi:hypothetical protein
MRDVVTGITTNCLMDSSFLLVKARSNLLYTKVQRASIVEKHASIRWWIW